MSISTLKVAERASGLDFKAIFGSLPGLYMVLDPDLTIVAATDAFLKATGSNRKSVLGRPVFEVFPDTSTDSGPNGEQNMRGSLNRVRQTLEPHRMPVQQHALKGADAEDGQFELRFWSPINSPVLDQGGRFGGFLLELEDITESVHSKVAAQEQHDASVVLKYRTDERHAGEVRRSERLTLANTELRGAGEVLDEIVRERTEELQVSLEELHQINLEHQLLLRRIVTLQEEEQKRIANDIHDDTLQSVIVAQMRLQVFKMKVTDEASSAELGRIHTAVGDAVARLRTLMFELRPDDLCRGVASVLKRHLDDIAKVSDIRADVTDTWSKEPDGVEQLTIYRIAREALINIRKHVSNGQVTVLLTDVDDGWSIEIRDEGAGFVVAEGLAANGHLGLTAMRERAVALGGRWQIESTPGIGTTVCFWIPYRSGVIAGSAARALR